MRSTRPRAAVLAWVTPVLVLVPALALAQGDASRGTGMPGGMGAGGSMMERRERSEEPSKLPPAPAQGAPAGGGMTGDQMEHRVPALPFYRERTFLVLVGVGAAAGGFLIYRLTRSRWRRRGGPAAFVTEAVLVVDLVDSTRLATHYGDGLAMRARTVLKDRALALAEQHGLAFVENTGDGYLMTFPFRDGGRRHGRLPPERPARSTAGPDPRTAPRSLIF